MTSPLSLDTGYNDHVDACTCLTSPYLQCVSDEEFEALKTEVEQLRHEVQSISFVITIFIIVFVSFKIELKVKRTLVACMYIRVLLSKANTADVIMHVRYRSEVTAHGRRDRLHCT